MTFRTHIRRFRRDERGLALVELALGLPFLLFILFLTIEGGRMFYAYQSVIQGVRDASRYVARVVPTTVCPSGPSDLTGFVSDTKLDSLISRNASASAAFPSAISVTNVEISRRCVGSAGDYRMSSVPVAQVTATLVIDFPFSSVASIASGRNMGTITTTVTDESRIFGL